MDDGCEKRIRRSLSGCGGNSECGSRSEGESIPAIIASFAYLWQLVISRTKRPFFTPSSCGMNLWNFTRMYSVLHNRRAELVPYSFCSSPCDMVWGSVWMGNGHGRHPSVDWELKRGVLGVAERTGDVHGGRCFIRSSPGTTRLYTFDDRRRPVMPREG